jgi:hypothetical protein
MAKTYCRAVGAILLLIGVVDIVAQKMMHMSQLLGFELHLSHSAVHLVSGFVLLWAAGGTRARTFALLFGAIYVLVAVAGLAGWAGDLGGYVHLGLNTKYNLIHAVVGLLGVIAGFAGKGAEAARGAAA